jgi:hypothetical protein
MLLIFFQVFGRTRPCVCVRGGGVRARQYHVVKQGKLYGLNHMDQLRLSDDNNVPLEVKQSTSTLESQER